MSSKGRLVSAVVVAIHSGRAGVQEINASGIGCEATSRTWGLIRTALRLGDALES
jgi:hypothetical protein